MRDHSLFFMQVIIMTGNKRLKKIANAVIILGGVFGLLEIVIKVREKFKQGS